jgi:solute carrier family 25 S-adenosylmethionine transporter 26
MTIFGCFLQGIGPRVLWIGLGGSIFFGVLERTKQMLAQRRLPSQNPISFKD